MKRLVFVATLTAVIGLLTVAPSTRNRTLAAAEAVGSYPSAAHSTTSSALSSYWHRKVQRWSDLILLEADRRDLDPDFLASLVWMESRGDPNAVGPVGAVGLMQVMPKEAGFSWRPTREVLLDPGTNLFWGTRTLATVIRQGKGDIFNALAAYNGGWEQVMYRGPKRFATTILRDYAHAVALRYGLMKGWTAVFAVRQNGGIRGPIWIAAASRSDVYAFGDENVTPEGGPLVPDMAPTSVVASCLDEQDAALCDVGVWIYNEADQQWVAPTEAVLETEPNEPSGPSVSVMTGSSRPGELAASSVSPPGPTPTHAPETAPAVTTVLDGGAPAVHNPAASQTATPEPTPALPTCAGGPLTVDAWPLDRDFIVGTETTPEGWKVRIYAEGRGGDCVYTYAWNDESDIRVANVRGAATFEVTSTRRDCVIVGTVVVISGDSVKRVGMYIHPPK
ncbi:MAG: transglycosylase SLT domain-containing protein [Anaerolineae bacterium]|nr:transglycosylase SLT domain-containing protein [Anaerolineae bacterium]